MKFHPKRFISNAIRGQGLPRRLRKIAPEIM